MRVPFKGIVLKWQTSLLLPDFWRYNGPCWRAFGFQCCSADRLHTGCERHAFHCSWVQIQHIPGFVFPMQTHKVVLLTFWRLQNHIRNCWIKLRLHTLRLPDISLLSFQRFAEACVLPSGRIYGVRSAPPNRLQVQAWCKLHDTGGLRSREKNACRRWVRMISSLLVISANVLASLIVLYRVRTDNWSRS